jgi:hypothetical protein
MRGLRESTGIRETATARFVAEAGGALRGLDMREGELASIVRDRLKPDNYVEIVHAEIETAKRHARTMIDNRLAGDSANT